jgi:hypothetical protein
MPAVLNGTCEAAGKAAHTLCRTAHPAKSLCIVAVTMQGNQRPAVFNAVLCLHTDGA